MFLSIITLSIDCGSNCSATWQNCGFQLSQSCGKRSRQACCSYQDISTFFFFNKHSFNCCKHWLISRVLKKLNSTIFANVLFAVIEKCIFGHSDSAMPEMLPPHSWILTLQILHKFEEIHRSIFINHILFPQRGRIINLIEKYTTQGTSRFEVS